MDNKNNCIICGAELEYFNSPKTIECELCHRIFQTNAACKNGHYICDKCHSTNAVELIRSVCGSTKSKNLRCICTARNTTYSWALRLYLLFITAEAM